MSACEIDYFEVCNSLFQECETSYLKKCAIVIYVIFVKQASEKWNVGSKSEKQYELKCQLVKPIISKCETVYFKIVKYVLSKLCSWSRYDLSETNQWKVKCKFWMWKTT